MFIFIYFIVPDAIAGIRPPAGKQTSTETSASRIISRITTGFQTNAASATMNNPREIITFITTIWYLSARYAIKKVMHWPQARQRYPSRIKTTRLSSNSIIWLTHTTRSHDNSARGTNVIRVKQPNNVNWIKRTTSQEVVVKGNY